MNIQGHIVKLKHSHMVTLQMMIFYKGPQHKELIIILKDYLTASLRCYQKFQNVINCISWEQQRNILYEACVLLYG